MAWVESLLKPLSTQSALMWWLLFAAAAVLLVSPVIAAWVVLRLPSNYFVNPRQHPPVWQAKNSALRFVVVVGKNLLGVVLLAAGLVMLLTPGQGLLTVAIALLLLDFPGKYRFERWLVTRKPVWRSINWLRKRARRKEFEPPQ
jgi:hypothetical protein